MEKFSVGVIGVVLAIQTFFDVKYKKVPVILTTIGGIIGVIILLIQQGLNTEVFWALLPGCLCMLYSKLSREALGYGDSFMVLIMGLFCSLDQLIILLMIAFGIAGCTALILLVIFHRNKKYEIALFPFLFAAYVVIILFQIEGGGL